MESLFHEDCDPAFEKIFKENVIYKVFNVGDILASESDSCNYLPIVIDGGVRVYKTSDSGRELTLYRIEPGESCILTTFCIMNDDGFPAIARVEEMTELYLVPSNLVRDWMDRYKGWRSYIFSVLSRRLETTLLTLTELAFKRVDLRLLEYLINKHETKGVRFETTHQQMASDLGTAREVISRLLKELEKQGIVRIFRGEIEIQNKEAILKKISIINRAL